MLIITKLRRGESGVMLKLEGRIVREWAEVLKEESERQATHGRPVLLDCSAVSFVDRLGIEIVTGLIRDRVVELVDCPEFIRQLLSEGDKT